MSCRVCLSFYPISNLRKILYLIINVPGLFSFFSYDSNHLFIRLTFFCALLQIAYVFSRKIEKNEKVTISHFIRANLPCIILDGGIV